MKSINFLVLGAIILTFTSCSFESMSSFGATAQYPFGKSQESKKEMKSSTVKPDETLSPILSQ